MSIVRAAVAAGVLSTLALFPAGPSSARAEEVVDPGTADVWKRFFDAELDDEDWSWEPAGSLQNTDVVSVVVRHTDKRLQVRATFADLAEVSDYRPQYTAQFKLDDTRTVWFPGWIDEEGGLRTILVGGGKADRAQLVAQRADIECEGLRARFRWDDDVYVGSVPRSCLRDPRWVKFHGRSISAPTGENGYDVTWWDNQQTAGHGLEGWTGRIKTG